MMATTPLSYLILAMLLFSIGLLGVIARRNIFIIYMSIELMLNAINLMLITLSYVHQNLSSHVMAMLIIAIAAAEAAVFLSLIVVLYKRKKSLDSDLFRSLSQKEYV